MIAQRAQQDTHPDDTESVSREQYEAMKRAADKLLFWVEKARWEGSGALMHYDYMADLDEARQLGLIGDRK